MASSYNWYRITLRCSKERISEPISWPCFRSLPGRPGEGRARAGHDWLEPPDTWIPRILQVNNQEHIGPPHPAFSLFISICIGLLEEMQELFKTMNRKQSGSPGLPYLLFSMDANEALKVNYWTLFEGHNFLFPRYTFKFTNFQVERKCAWNRVSVIKCRFVNKIIREWW